MPVAVDNDATPLFEPDAAVIRQHLELLFRRARVVYPEGLCEIAWSDGQEKVTSANTFPITPPGLDDATALAMRHNRARRNVYVGVNPRKASSPAYGRNGNEAVEIAFFQFAEIDSAEGAQKLRQAPLPYTWAVTTGRVPNPRPHAYWEIEEPIRNLAAWAAQQRALSDCFLGDVMTDPARIMRLAGTVNYPSRKKIERGYRVEKVTLRHLYDGDERSPVSSEALLRVYPWARSGERIDPETGEVHENAKETGRSYDQRDPLEWVRNIDSGVNLHNNTRDLAAHLVATGHRNWLIQEFLTRLLSPVSDGGTLADIPHLVQSARLKYRAPDPIDDYEVGETPPKAPLPLEWFSDVKPNLDVADFVEGLLTESGLSVVYGESNCGKTFFMTDLAFHIATGRPWREREVDKGGVIYVALEGGFGIRNRLAALRIHYAIGAERIPFAIVPCAVNLLDADADTDPLIALIKAAAQEINVPVRLVVIDTLARAMNGGNENAPEDMGKLIKAADRIRDQTKAHVTFVHHSGKDAARGARGHSSLRAATDTEIEITRNDDSGNSLAKVTKQRELEIAGEFPFTLEQVELGINRRGKMVTSCVVIDAGSPEGTGKRARLAGDEYAFLKEIKELMSRENVTETMAPERGMPILRTVRREVVRDWLVSRGRLDVTERVTGDVTRKVVENRERQRLWRVLNALRDKGYLEMNADRVWLLGEQS